MVAARFLRVDKVLERTDNEKSPLSGPQIHFMAFSDNMILFVRYPLDGFLEALATGNSKEVLWCSVTVKCSIGNAARGLARQSYLRPNDTHDALIQT